MRIVAKADPAALDDGGDGEESGLKSALGHTRPRTYEELRAVLASGTIHFPKRLRQVAIFLWQHPDDVALGTIVQVAEQAGVQPSTLVRFAKSFGFSGFSEFQSLFKDHVKGTWPEGRAREVEPAATEETRASLHFLSGMIGAARTSLDRIGETIDVASFGAMVGLLAEADLIYLVGSKRAFPVVTYLSLTLSQQGVRNVLVDNVGSTAFDQIGCIGRRDGLLAVSFSPYNSITPDLVRVAHEREAGIVAITDSTFSPLIPLARHSIEVIEADFAGFRSLAASLSVGMALVHGIAARRAAQGRGGD